MSEAEPLTFRCACCGRTISGLPDLAYDAPAYYHDLPEAERDQRARLNSDLCSVDDEHFFVRAVCAIPIRGSGQSFGFGVWVSLSRENFGRYRETFDDPDQSKLGAMFGWFNNQLPVYSDTLSLQTNVVPQDDNQRPLVRISEVHADHPLFLDQRDGMTRQRLGEIYAAGLCDKGRA